MLKAGRTLFQMASKFPLSKTTAEWQAQLSPQQFAVLRQNGTERPNTGEYLHNNKQGIYHCVGCDSPLYSSSTKFDSRCGWPAFYEALPGALVLIRDSTLGMERIEMRCAGCDSHLGHVFKGEGWDTPTDERHCVNSVCLKFQEAEAK